LAYKTGNIPETVEDRTKVINGLKSYTVHGFSIAGKMYDLELPMSEHFTYMATCQLSRDTSTTVDDLGDISRSLDCFISNFS